MKGFNSLIIFCAIATALFVTIAQGATVPNVRVSNFPKYVRKAKGWPDKPMILESRSPAVAAVLGSRIANANSSESVKAADIPESVEKSQKSAEPQDQPVLKSVDDIIKNFDMKKSKNCSDDAEIKSESESTVSPTALTRRSDSDYAGDDSSFYGSDLDSKPDEFLQDPYPEFGGSSSGSAYRPPQPPPRPTIAPIIRPTPFVPPISSYAPQPSPYRPTSNPPYRPTSNPTPYRPTGQGYRPTSGPAPYRPPPQPAPIGPGPGPGQGQGYRPTTEPPDFTFPDVDTTQSPLPPSLPTVPIITVTRPPPPVPVDVTDSTDFTDLGTFPPSTGDSDSGSSFDLTEAGVFRPPPGSGSNLSPGPSPNPNTNRPSPSATVVPILGLSGTRSFSGNRGDRDRDRDFDRNRDRDGGSRSSSFSRTRNSNPERDRDRDSENNSGIRNSSGTRDDLDLDRDQGTRSSSRSRDRDRTDFDRERESDDDTRSLSRTRDSDLERENNNSGARRFSVGDRDRDRDGGTRTSSLLSSLTRQRGSSRSLFDSSKRTPPAVGANLPQRRVVTPNTRTTVAGSAIAKERDLDEDPSIIKDFMFSDIKCFRTKSREYFGAMVHLKGGFHLPYIRDRPADPLSSNECLMERTDSPNSYHMKISDLRSCGVELCGDQNLCLTMVFPRVPNLALADDEVTTIKCTPQKSTMTETRTISFAGDSLDTRRSSSTVEGGGQEFAAEVGVFRQNPGTKNGLFVKRVNSGGVVQLGEPLQLRSVVRGGDGWTYSRLTDVKVWRMRDTFSNDVEKLNPNDASEVITLVDQRGCRNGDFRVISESHPLRDPRNDLVHHFNFKAFLFRGQRANEPLVVTAKVQACQDPDDCITDDCNSIINRDATDDLEKSSSRFKRSPAEVKNSSSIIHDWNSQMALRVVGLTDHPSSLTEEDFYSAGARGDHQGTEGRSFGPTYSCPEKIAGAALGAGFVMLLLSSLIFTLISFCHRSRMLKRMRMGMQVQSENPKPGHSDHVLDLSESSTLQSASENWTLKRNPGFDSNSKRNGRNSRKLNSKAANKPLPSLPPKEKFTKADVSKLLQQISSQNQNDQQPTTAEYECIPDEEDNISADADNNNNSPKKKNKKSDGVYIVYCCNKKGGRSRSAPPTHNKLPRGFISETGDETQATATEDSDNSSASGSSQDNYPAMGMGIGGGIQRRTVRSTKRNHHRYRGSRQKELHGSFPRVICKRTYGPGTGTRSCRERRHVNFAETFENIPSPSSEDSAYSGSVSSKMTAGSITDTPSNPKPKPFYKGSPNAQPSNATLSRILNLGSNSTRNSNPNTSLTHFVTRSDESTRIIIIPETNV